MLWVNQLDTEDPKIQVSYYKDPYHKSSVVWNPLKRNCWQTKHGKIKLTRYCSMVLHCSQVFSYALLIRAKKEKQTKVGKSLWGRSPDWKRCLKGGAEQVFTFGQLRWNSPTLAGLCFTPCCCTACLQSLVRLGIGTGFLFYCAIGYIHA